MDIMYEVPGSDITQVTITREVVEQQSKPLYQRVVKEESGEEKTPAAVKI
jgi:ATP-dependent protease Clp ATPase subunit